MKLSGLFSGAAKKTTESALLSESQQLFKKSLGDLTRFTQQEMPKLTRNQADAMTALEQLGRQAQAAIKKAH